MARQYELMVGSYNAATPDNNGGRLGFYPVDGVNNSVTKRIEYKAVLRRFGMWCIVNDGK